MSQLMRQRRNKMQKKTERRQSHLYKMSLLSVCSIFGLDLLKVFPFFFVSLADQTNPNVMKIDIRAYVSNVPIIINEAECIRIHFIQLEKLGVLSVNAYTQCILDVALFLSRLSLFNYRRFDCRPKKFERIVEDWWIVSLGRKPKRNTWSKQMILFF